MLVYIKALIAGFVSVLTFHQGTVWLLDAAGYLTAQPWSMAPVPPLGVPRVISLAFWGALWAVVLWLLIRRAEAAGYYASAIILGAILPTAVALLLVPLVHGVSLSGVFDGIGLYIVAVGLVVNAMFGLGVAIFMRVMHPPR